MTSYLRQVRQLRALAHQGAGRFGLHVGRVQFLRYGENATFCVHSVGGPKYLLRLHRADYHSARAIGEELRWLRSLQGRVPVPAPRRSRLGRWVEEVGGRPCTVLAWQEGRFIRKHPTFENLFNLGHVCAQLQTSAPAARHRRYWSADGLLGKQPKFGSIDALTALPPAHQLIVTQARRQTWAVLRKFERRYPQRMGLIHADLHFGNILLRPKELVVIDFDDCGYGFHAYDLVVPYLSLERTLGWRRRRELPDFKAALLDGYCTLKTWDDADEQVFAALITARKLLMLGWLHSRSDNPRLQRFFAGAVREVLRHLDG